MANTPKFKVSQISEALRQTGGLKSLAAKILGCSPSTITNYINKYSSLDKVLDECIEETLDIAEAQLIKKIQEGNVPSITFFLKTKGKERGYTERQELTGKDGKDIRYVIKAPPKIKDYDEWAATFKPKEKEET